MKFVLAIKHIPLIAGHKIIECSDFLEENGYEGIGTNEFEFNTEAYHKFMSLVGNKFRFAIAIYIEMTKGKMNKQKAFTFRSRSVIADKNDIGYSKKTQDLFDDSKFCYNPTDKFPVHAYKKCGIKGTLKVQPDYFKTSESGVIDLAVFSKVKKLLEENKITGCHFENVENIKKEKLEDFFCMTSESLMDSEFIFDNMCKENQYFECKRVLHAGLFIYPQSALDNIKDFSYTKEATDGCQGTIIVSQKFRQLYLKEKLKGGLFDPVLEVGTDAFEWYNEKIAQLAKDLTRYEQPHVIGITNKIDSNFFINGVLPDSYLKSE